MNQSVLKISTEAQQQIALEQAAKTIEKGGSVILPTDTVYGIAASAFNPEAIQKLYRMKDRDPQKSIAVLLSGSEEIPLVAESYPEAARILAKAYWPGGMTLLLPRRLDLPSVISANMKIGVRVPDHPFVRALIRRCGPLATTSANHSGELPALMVLELDSQLLSLADLVIDGGQAKIGIASTVIDCTVEPVEILRVGSVSAEAIQQTLGIN